MKCLFYIHMHCCEDCCLHWCGWEADEYNRAGHLRLFNFLYDEKNYWGNVPITEFDWGIWLGVGYFNVPSPEVDYFYIIEVGLDVFLWTTLQHRRPQKPSSAKKKPVTYLACGPVLYASHCNHPKPLSFCHSGLAIHHWRLVFQCDRPLPKNLADFLIALLLNVL